MIQDLPLNIDFTLSSIVTLFIFVIKTRKISTIIFRDNIIILLQNISI